MKLRYLRRRKQRLVVLAAFCCAAAVAFAACGGGDSSSSSTSPSSGSDGSNVSQSGGGTEGLKVGLFMTGSSNAYQTTVTKTIEEKADEYGMDLTVLQSNFEPQVQINQMQLAMQRDSFDYWILVADSGEQECGAVKSAIAAGIPVYLLVTNVCGGEDVGALGFVGVQTPEAYEEWFEYIFKENEPQEMAVITGPAEVDITGYAEEALETEHEKYPEFDVVAVQNTDYTTGNAYQVTQDLLQAHPNLGIIASNYAGMTGGVVQAVKAAGKVGEVKIYDLLGDKIIAKNIKNGEVVATLPALPVSESEYAVESVAKAAEGEKVEKNYNPLAGLTIKGGPFITKANVDEFEFQY